MQKKMKKYVLITPTYNEVENIEKTIHIVLNSFPKDPKKEFHILVVDGNSPDGTADVVRKLIKIHTNVHLLMEKEKKGLGAAYLQAMSYCFDEMSADYVFMFDADLSHDPNKIKDMVSLSDGGKDYIIGTRYTEGGGIPKEWAFYRKLLSKGGNLFARLVFMRMDVTDWTSGYALFSKKVFNKIKDKAVLEKGYTFIISLKKSALNEGFNIVEVPYHFKDREKGVSKIGPEYLIRALIFVVTTRIKEIMGSSFFKVCLVGGVGTLVQLTFFGLFFTYLGFNNYISLFLSVEFAIISNYILNNNFSFRASKISGSIVNSLSAFGKFNLISGGSLLIQTLTQYIGTTFFGSDPINVYTFVIVGIVLGLVSNFYFYKTLVWKIK